MLKFSVTSQWITGETGDINRIQIIEGDHQDGFPAMGGPLKKTSSNSIQH